MNNRKKEQNKAPLLAAGIILIAVAMMSEIFPLIPIGIFLIVFQIVLKVKEKNKKTAQPRKTAVSAFEPQKKTVAIEYDAETRRAGKGAEDSHSIHHMQSAKFTHDPHMQYTDMMLQAQAEIRNLKNIRYARSELTGKTLSDTVIWHSHKGVCSSVVQIIRQGNLRYPDLSDKELSDRILADKDLMESLAENLEWERRTEIRWN